MRVEIFAADWIFALFANIIPSSQMHNFYDAFFKEVWIFFYRFALAFLDVMSSRILEVDEEDEIKDLIKQPLQSRKFLEERTETRGSFLSIFGKIF